MDIALLAVFSVLVFAGIFAVFVPVFPALFYMLTVATIYGFVDHFERVTPNNLWVLAGIFALAFVVDSLSGVLGAKYGGASKKAMLWGFAGLVIGAVLLPPFGAIPGLFVGVLAAEIAGKKGGKDALKAAAGSVLGAVAGMAVNAMLAIAFFALFMAFALF
jgi:uncharacterized protein YqgC (DUF456 family)